MVMGKVIGERDENLGAAFAFGKNNSFTKVVCFMFRCSDSVFDTFQRSDGLVPTPSIESGIQPFRAAHANIDYAGDQTILCAYSTA